MTTSITRGQKKIDWARSHMPVQQAITARFRSEKPLVGHRIGMSLHLEAKTAALAVTLAEGGASLYVIESNPLATQDDVAAALGTIDGITVDALRGVSEEEHKEHIESLLNADPTLIVEDGGEVIARIAERGADRSPSLVGLSEETTTGVEQLASLQKEGRLEIPAIAVNSARMKHLLDNRYGTGQSTWDAIMRASNLLIAGKMVLIVGYGWCGKGLAIRARGLGARVVVCELDEIKAVEALMEGFSVAPIERALPMADIIITATGRPGVIGTNEIPLLRDGVVLANAGHFAFEIDRDALAAAGSGEKPMREGVAGYGLPGGRIAYLLGRGELVNLSVADGHPIEIMDISFGLQALSLEYLGKNHPALEAKVHPVPEDIERAVARIVLATLSPA